MIKLDKDLGKYQKGETIEYSNLLVYSKKQLSSIYEQVDSKDLYITKDMYKDFYVNKDIYKNILAQANTYAACIEEFKNIINSNITNDNLIFLNNDIFRKVGDIIHDVKHNELPEFVDINNKEHYDDIPHKLNSIREKCCGLKEYVLDCISQFEKTDINNIEETFNISEDLYEVFTKIHYRIMQIIDEILWLYANNEKIRKGKYVSENFKYNDIRNVNRRNMSAQFIAYIDFFEEFTESITYSHSSIYDHNIKTAYDFLRTFRIHTNDSCKRFYNDFKEADDDDAHYYCGEYVKYIVQLCKIYSHKGLFKLILNRKLNNLNNKYFNIYFDEDYSEMY